MLDAASMTGRVDTSRRACQRSVPASLVCGLWALSLACPGDAPVGGDSSSTRGSGTDEGSSATSASASSTTDVSADSSGSGSSSGGPLAPPTLDAIEPALGDTLGGVAVTVHGTGLSQLVAVTIGDVPCTALDQVAQTHALCIAPALPAGVHDVVVTTPQGSATLPLGYEAWTPASLAGARVLQADAGVTLARAAAPAPLWRTLAATAPWHPRDGAGLLALDDRLLLLGGWDSGVVRQWGGQVTTNEVWASDDGGQTWDLLLAHDAAPPSTGPGARWSARHTAGWLTAEIEGQRYAYVIGGDIYDAAADVWRSVDGQTWTRIADGAPWGARVLHMVASFDDALWLMGGQTDVSDPATALADVWRSDDGGETWQQQPDAPWPARAMVYGPVEHDGLLWIAGGGTYAYDSADRAYFSDVWSFDGNSWNEELADGAAPWAGRQYHNLFAWQGELWIGSGWLADAANHNDVWHSSDGVTWTRALGTAFAPGHADGVAVTAAGPIHASGNAFDTAVHRLETATAAPVTAWAEQGDGGATLLPPDQDARPLWLAQAFADQPGLWFDGTDARLLRPARDPQPQGRSVFWVGRSPRERTAPPSINAPQTLVGDSSPASRAQVGYDNDALAMVVTDASGSWRGGEVTSPSLRLAEATRLVGFTHALDGTVQAFVDGVASGPAAARAYDARFMAWDTLGAGYGGDARAQLVLGAVVIVPAVLDDDTRAKLLQWSRKWGVSP